MKKFFNLQNSEDVFKVPEEEPKSRNEPPQQTGMISLKDYIKKRASRDSKSVSSRQGNEMIGLNRLQQKRNRAYSNNVSAIFSNEKA